MSADASIGKPLDALNYKLMAFQIQFQSNEAIVMLGKCLLFQFHCRLLNTESIDTNKYNYFDIKMLLIQQVFNI